MVTCVLLSSTKTRSYPQARKVGNCTENQETPARKIDGRGSLSIRPLFRKNMKEPVAGLTRETPCGKLLSSKWIKTENS